MLANIYKKKDLRNITNVNPLDFTGPYVSSSRLAIGNLFKRLCTEQMLLIKNS